MKWSEMSTEEQAEYLIDCYACPKNEDGDLPCIYDEEGDQDCKTCWAMILNDEERDNGYDPDEAKVDGRGYRV